MTYTRDWSQIGPVRISYAGGQHFAFETIDAAVRKVGWYKIEACRDRGLDTESDPHGHFAGRALWVFGDPVAFYDEMGMRIPASVVQGRAMALRLHYYGWYWIGWRRLARPNYVFRQGPVPNTGGGRTRGRRYHTLRTAQEIRETRFLDAFDEEAAEHGIRVRRARMKLPTWWDDPAPGRVPDQSWKRYRKTQWR